MFAARQIEALHCLKEVRWRLLESFALARQEGMLDPVGLVIDGKRPFAHRLSEGLLLAADNGAPERVTTTCMERSALASLLSAVAPELSAALRSHSDEPGRWTAVILADQGSVLTGTWQELFTLEIERSGRARAQR